jgi:C_GCAxxG_C_C family probable redox protein
MMNDSQKAIISQAVELAGEYKLQGFHCSESVIRACAEAIGIHLSDDVLRAACGFRGGGGGYMDRCGVIEAGCMLISSLYGRLTPDQPDWDYSYLICVLHDRFKEHFESLYCRDIMPAESKKGGPVCIRVYTEGAEIVTRLLLEAREILDGVPPEDQGKRKLWFPF